MKILVVEDEKGINKKIVDGLRYLLGKMGMYVEVISCYTYEEALMFAKELDIKTFVVDINLSKGRDGVELVKELRELGYVYNGVIFVTEKKGDSYKVEVHEQTQYARFLTKPVNIEELAGEVFLQLNAPDQPKDEYLPKIRQGNLTFMLNRETTLLIQKVKHKSKIEVWFKDKPCEVYPIFSFERLVEELLPEHENQFRQCERGTIINTKFIERVNSAKHYVKLSGYSEEILIGTTFREMMYTLFG